ncbi:(2Fe-2S)-binding protein [Mameliella alba]|uniref:Carbon monoxide dehydrogenase small chain n=1 Tax=Mameliella alba TaxID=561184 RepID=A0A0B3RFM1_9RHOB|nr:(2Fe-2S)-binding protein [Mameliella alba]KHQ50020.1 Carbon monoxide dehydrogenase small chain [Mameliella alba]
MPRLTKDDTHPVRFTLNGRPVSVRVSPRTLLTDALRHEIGATGTHVGCEHGVCGACTVQVDGEPARACLMLAQQAEGCAIRTVEGLGKSDALTPLQEAFREHFALQCGFCTAGILMTLDALFSRQPDAEEDAIREALSGNLCRCTGYAPIVQAALAARNRIKGGPIDA